MAKTHSILEASTSITVMFRNKQQNGSSICRSDHKTLTAFLCNSNQSEQCTKATTSSGRMHSDVKHQDQLQMNNAVVHKQLYETGQGNMNNS